MITWIAVGAVAVMALTILGLGCVVWARLSGYGRVPATDEPGMRMDRYEPLTRLLADDDLEFLRGLRGCPTIAAEWKRARVRIVRLYLSDLAADFRCLHAKARALVAESPEQYSDLVGVLMRQQITFWRVMAEAELRLIFRWLDLERLDARRLVEAIATMEAEIGRASAPAPA
jgi:hypothetical protein